MTRSKSQNSGWARCLLPVLLTMAGCSAGSGDGLNASGRPISEGEDLPLAPTLASLQSNVFDPVCIVCHSGAAAPLGLRLDAANSFVNLVGMRSQQNSSTLRVEPGAPGRSYLVQKLEGTASSGDQMPLGGPPLPRSTIDFVRQWISDGALANESSPAGLAPQIMSTTPGSGSELAAFPLQITVAFDREIDASTINDLTVRLSGDANNNPVVLTSMRLSPANPRLLVIDLDRANRVPDRFQLVVSGSGPNYIMAVDGAALYEDFVAEFMVTPGETVEPGTETNR